MYATLSIPSIHTLILGQPPWQQELHKAFSSVSPTSVAMDEENPHDGPGLIKLDMTLFLEVFLDCVSVCWDELVVAEVKVSYSRSLDEFGSFCWGFFAVRWMFPICTGVWMWETRQFATRWHTACTCGQKLFSLDFREGAPSTSTNDFEVWLPQRCYYTLEAIFACFAQRQGNSLALAAWKILCAMQWACAQRRINTRCRCGTASRPYSRTPSSMVNRHGMVGKVI